MYRCINRQVNLKEDNYNKKIIPYKKGNTKIFWGFTSITSDINMIYNLNGKKKILKMEQFLHYMEIFMVMILLYSML